MNDEKLKYDPADPYGSCLHIERAAHDVTNAACSAGLFSEETLTAAEYLKTLAEELAGLLWRMRKEQAS